MFFFPAAQAMGCFPASLLCVLVAGHTAELQHLFAQLLGMQPVLFRLLG